LAGLAQPVEALVFVRRRGGALGVVQRVELVAREQVAVALDDLGLLRRLLLADAHGAALLRALEEVALQALLELGRAEDGRDAHGRNPSPITRWIVVARSPISNGFESTASARPRASGG